MRQRRVTEEDVESVLENPDERRPARPRRGAKPAEILFGYVGYRRLRVYVEIGTDPPLVKSVGWG
jgi:hypothetical protein